MSLALGHPEFGYYMKKDPFGAAGDFTTAPEISQMFGELIGAWVADTWQKMGEPRAFTLLECGPGRGTLMADMIRATRGVKGFHEAAHICFLEMSPVLQNLQEESCRTPAFAGVTSVEWSKTLEAVPTNKPVICVANEFLDALPIRQFVKNEKGWQERVIMLADGQLHFGLINAVENRPGNTGDAFEISPVTVGFIGELSAMIKKTGGAALFIDYGYATGAGDTFQALYRHQHISPLEHIGDADLTAHVDFAAVKQAAGDARTFGPVEQGAFLRNLGIEGRVVTLSSRADARQKDDIQSALKRLIDSDQMGSLFKVFGFSHGKGLDLAGF